MVTRTAGFDCSLAFRLTPRIWHDLPRPPTSLPMCFCFAAGFLAGVARRFSRRLRGGKFPAFPGRPAGFVDLAAAADSQAVVRHVFGDGRARGDVSVVSDAHRSHENRITTDENPFADGRGVFLEAIVIARNGASADVGLGAYLGVAQVGEV